MPAVLTGDVASVLSDAHVDAGGTQARAVRGFLSATPSPLSGGCTADGGVRGRSRRHPGA